MRRRIDREFQAALDQCASMIRVGSKSFSLAAKIFSPKTRSAATFLYGWCRYCDDQTDDKVSGDSAAIRENRLLGLIDSTRSALAGRPQENPVFLALQYVARRYSIPEHYPTELLEGMAMDVRGQRYETLEDLLLYCYRVAGTVGLMMAHVMGVSDEKALKNAADLGIAMQLTNIARDIVEDAINGRVYLPLSWLREAGVPPDEVAAPEHRRKIAALAFRLLTEAEKYYASGDEGLRYLAFRSACSIAGARQVYSSIGALIRERGPDAWDDRAVTSRSRKIGAIARGVLQVVRSIPERAVKPWSPAPINKIWRHPAAA